MAAVTVNGLRGAASFLRSDDAYQAWVNKHSAAGDRQPSVYWVGPGGREQIARWLEEEADMREASRNEIRP